MLILLTTRHTFNVVTGLVRANRNGPVPLSEFPVWRQTDRPAGTLWPTVPAALRAAMEIREPALLAVNCVPYVLAPMPNSYEVESDLTRITAKPLPTQPGKLGLDFAAAFALCQLSVASKLDKTGDGEHAAYFTEAAGLSAAAVCSVASAEIMEQMYAAFQDDPAAVPWPESILWPDDVSEWLAGFGFAKDERG